MRRSRSSAALSTLVAFSSAFPLLARADEPEKPKPVRAPLPETPRTAEIKTLIEALGSNDFQKREQAQARLLKIGEDALPWLERATKDEDPERADAAKELLNALRWKVPERIEAMIGKPLEDYPSQPVEARRLALDKVAEHLVESRLLAPLLSNVARFDPDPELRRKGLDLYLKLTPQGDPARDELVLETLDAEPPSQEVHFARARILLRLGRTDEALKAARRATAGDKADPASLRLLAETLLTSGLHAEAFAILERLVQKSPDDLDLAARLGEAYLLAGEKAKGEEVFAALLKRTIRDRALEKAVLLRVARSWMHVGRLDDAQEVMQKALARHPNDNDVNVAVAELDLAQGRIAQALKRFLNEARYCPPASEALRAIRASLTALFEKIGEPEVAAEDELYDDARRGRDVAASRARAGRFLLARGLLEEAARYLRSACALAQENVEARIALGDTLRTLGREDEAKKAYEAARAIAPKDERIGERLRALALGTPLSGRGPAIERRGDVAAWDRRIPRDELAQEPEAVTVNAPPPIVAGGRVVAIPAGTRTVYAFDATSGASSWKLRLDLPSPPEGVSQDRVGLEVVGLAAVPSALAATSSPRRARDPAPLVLVVANELVRAAGRSFKKASVEGALGYLVDSKDGKLLDRFLLEEEQVFPGAPLVAQGARLLVVTAPAEDRWNLVFFDLVSRKARWKQRLAGGPTARPIFAGDVVVAAYGSGVAVFGADGSLRSSVLEGEAPSTGVELSQGSLWFGTRGTGESSEEKEKAGTLVSVALDSGRKRELAQAPQNEPFSGDIAVIGTRVFAGTRGGSVRAYDSESGRPLAAALADKLERAASRSLLALGGKVFALNGSQDAYADEAPALLALDPSDLACVWRRPVGRPAALGSGEGVVVAASGGTTSQGGLRIVAARPGAAPADARPHMLAEVRAAAEDALADHEDEVGALLARKLVALRGGLQLSPTEDLVFLARTLARSNRPDEAESLLGLVRARDTSADADQKIEKLKAELGLLKPEPKDKPKAPDPNAKPSPEASPTPTPDKQGDK